MPSSIDLAYAAGLFDGEGCIYTAKGRPVCQVRMATPGPVEWLHSQWGGALRVETHRPDTARDTCRWQVQGNEAAHFLDDVLPFLRCKNRQAGLAIVLSILKPGPARADYVEAIRNLNKVGV